MYIYVGNLSRQVNEADLQKLFSQYGSVESVAVPRDKITDNAFGFAIVTMPDNNHASLAVEKLNRTQINGRVVIVSPTTETGEQRRVPRETNS